MTHQPFDHIVTEHGPTVLRVCRAALGAAGADAADDAWSETFLAALRAYPDLPADTNMQAWLVRVAHRKAIDQFRARARRPVPVPADEMPERPAPCAGPGAAGAFGGSGALGALGASGASGALGASGASGALGASGASGALGALGALGASGGGSDLWDALAALPDKQRFAVAYHHLVGMPYAEVGELLGNSEAAARRAAADGIKTLRGRFARAPQNAAPQNEGPQNLAPQNEGGNEPAHSPPGTPGHRQ